MLGANCNTGGADPSWFYRDLGESTSAPLEARLMCDQETDNEDVAVVRMELYVR